MVGRPVSVIIPAYNEGNLIESTVSAAKSIEGVREIIVVDDCSRDDTVLKALKAGARVEKLPKHKGKAYAIEHGLRVSSGDIVLFLDADLGGSAVEGRKLLQPIYQGNADLVIGTPARPSKRGGFGIVRAMAKWGVALLTQHKVSSPLSGQRALIKSKAEALLPFAPRFGLETGMTIDALLKGFRVVEVPVQMRHRETGFDLYGLVHRGLQFIDVFLALCSRLLSLKRAGA